MTTNNQMELEAVSNAMKYISNQHQLLGSFQATIVTDSSYVYEGVTKYLEAWKKKGWRLANKRPLKNLEQWIALDKLLQL
jgi:ribonuclease HI